MWQAFIDLIGSGLLYLNSGIAALHIPYSFGFAIILFTVIIKAITFPLNQKQMKSTRATQELQPKLKALQKKYANDKEKLSKAQMELYKEAGVNPLGGCLPMLVQMPVWFALYRSLYQLASTEPALQEGFFWIPSLAGPVQDRAAGLSWLWPLPPAVGWAAAIGYLVLPVLLVASQLYMQRMMSPSTGDDPNQKAMGQAMMFMPFMFGYFALIVPSGLSLYWFTNNILSMAQQYYTNKTMKSPDATAKKPEASKSADPKIIDVVASNGKEPAVEDDAPALLDLSDNAEETQQVIENDTSKPTPYKPRAKSKRKRRK